MQIVPLLTAIHVYNRMSDANFLNTLTSRTKQNKKLIQTKIFLVITSYVFQEKIEACDKLIIIINLEFG